MSSMVGLVEASSGAYGPLLLGALLLVGAVGVPLPGTALLLVAGALIREGVLGPTATVTLALTGAVLGDSVGYGLGRYGGSLFGWQTREDHAAGRAHGILERWGGAAVLFTRFLITPLAAPTNLVASGAGLSYRRFLAYDVTGEALWVGLYLGLGVSFADGWRVVSRMASDLGSTLVVATVLIGVAYLAYTRPTRPARPAGDGPLPGAPLPERKHRFFTGRS